MDRALQLALRDYSLTNSNEDAHRVAILLRRSINDRIASIPSKDPYGALTFAGLLRNLLDFTDSQLEDTVSHYNSVEEEWREATDLFTNDDLTDALDTGHGMLIDIRCDNCGSAFASERALRHFTEPDLDDICKICRLLGAHEPVEWGPPLCPCGHETNATAEGSEAHTQGFDWICASCGQRAMQPDDLGEELEWMPPGAEWNSDAPLAGPFCPNCGHNTVASGSGWECLNCGSTMGTT